MEGPRTPAFLILGSHLVPPLSDILLNGFQKRLETPNLSLGKKGPFPFILAQLSGISPIVL